MNINELIQVLMKFVETGKGDYTVFDEGYMNEITEDEITIDNEKRRIYL